MNKWEELNDFSMYDGSIPCVLCKEEAAKTIMGDHWKCSTCRHVFNKDGSDIGVKCYCDSCQEAEHEAQEKEEAKNSTLIQKALKKLEKVTKKISKKKKKTT